MSARVLAQQDTSLPKRSGAFGAEVGCVARWKIRRVQRVCGDGTMGSSGEIRAACSDIAAIMCLVQSSLQCECFCPDAIDVDGLVCTTAI